MKRSGMILSAICVALVMVSGAVAGEIDECKSIVQKAIYAFNTRDFPAYLALISDDVEVFPGIGTPYRISGKAAWKAFVEGLAAVPVTVYTEHDPSYRTYNGDTVLWNSYWDFTMVTKEGRATTLNGRASAACVKVGGKWLLVNLHFSRTFEGP